MHPDPPVGHVRAWPLRRFLEAEVPRRIVAKLGGATTVTQKPDAVITSDPEQWLAELPVAPVTRGGTRGGSRRGPLGGDFAPPSPGPAAPVSTPAPFLPRSSSSTSLGRSGVIAA